jgi:hypothetical protein
MHVISLEQHHNSGKEITVAGDEETIGHTQV